MLRDMLRDILRDILRGILRDQSVNRSFKVVVGYTAFNVETLRP
jgi:hypothetical protein